MSERKNLIITKVEEVKKVGNNQIPKLSFKAKDGDKELSFCTWRSSLFDAIKEGETINADVEVKTREWEGDTITERRITQIYVDGQPLGGKKGGQYYRGKSPEELDLSAKSYALSYAKDLAVAQVIPLEKITEQADIFYAWIKGNGDKSAETRTKVKSPASKVSASEPTEEQEFESLDKPEPSTPTGRKVQNVTELKGLLMKHKIETHEAYEILSIKGFMDLVDLDEAWQKIKKAKGIE